MLRKNYKTISSFTRAFHTKVDGLRIFQFLRNYQSHIEKNNENCLSDFLKQYYPHECSYLFKDEKTFSFATTSVEQLDEIRDFLMKQEAIYQQALDYEIKSF